MPALLTRLLVAFFILSGSFATYGQQGPSTFTNPLLPAGADPFTFYKDGYYYYMNTAGGRLVLRKTKNMTDLVNAEQKTIYVPPRGEAWSRELWAPEIHFIKGYWYVYFSADDGDNINHRIYVLQNSSSDPMKGEWKFKGKVADPSDKWAIDASVFEYQNKLYMVWSGWEGDVNGRQDIYIARMKTPLAIQGKRARISSPVYKWERNGDLSGNPSHVDVNEGPQPLLHGNKLFLVYSASGCWTDFYALGMLTFTGNNPLDSASWKKSPAPVFVQSPENGVYAPGHNSFFQSPDGKEDWILYHANSRPGEGCGGHRTPRAQKFTWQPDGTPFFGVPVKTGVPLTIPSGQVSTTEKIKD